MSRKLKSNVDNISPYFFSNFISHVYPHIKKNYDKRSDCFAPFVIDNTLIARFNVMIFYTLVTYFSIITILAFVFLATFRAMASGIALSPPKTFALVKSVNVLA